MESSSAVYHKPTTGKQAVSYKDLETEVDVDLLIELLARESDAARLPEKFSLLFSNLLFFYEASLTDTEISAQTVHIHSPHTHRNIT